jgi:ComF family protein
MSVIDKLISNIVPHDCLGCGYEGRIICAACAANFKLVPERCYRCRKISPGGRTCAACRRQSYLRAARAATSYDSLAKEVVWRLKFHGIQEAAAVMARQMALPGLDGSAMLVPVPTASSRARGRGYDQAKLLGRELSRQTKLPYIDCLRRVGQTHQVGASRRQRQAQLQGAFRVSRASLAGQAVILVDDVLTTGSTLEAAAEALKRAGARDINAIVFAQTEG